MLEQCWNEKRKRNSGMIVDVWVCGVNCRVGWGAVVGVGWMSGTETIAVVMLVVAVAVAVVVVVVVVVGVVEWWWWWWLWWLWWLLVVVVVGSG